MIGARKFPTYAKTMTGFQVNVLNAIRGMNSKMGGASLENLTIVNFEKMVFVLNATWATN